MVALLEEYNPSLAKTDPPAKKCSTENFCDSDNRVEKLLSQAQDLCPAKEECGYKTASGHSYGPFGELVSESGSYSAAEGSPDDCGKNTYKFSTKPQDTETGYYYYGFRYYDSSNGRWLNRDSLGEGGGINLHAFVINQSLNAVDVLGLEGLGAAGSMAGGASSFRAGVKGVSSGLYWNLGTIIGATVAKAAWEVFGMCSATFQGETFTEDDENACYVECYDKCEKPSQWQDNGTYKIEREYRCVGGHKNFIGKKLLSPCTASCSSGETKKESPSEAF